MKKTYTAPLVVAIIATIFVWIWIAILFPFYFSIPDLFIINQLNTPYLSTLMMPYYYLPFYGGFALFFLSSKVNIKKYSHCRPIFWGFLIAMIAGVLCPIADLAGRLSNGRHWDPESLSWKISEVLSVISNLSWIVLGIGAILLIINLIKHPKD